MPRSKKPSKKKKAKKIDFTTLKKAADETDVEVVKYRLVNVVSTCSLGCHLDLRAIALKSGFIEFNPSTFAAATLRIVYPRTTALLFASGNMVITGARNEWLSRLAARKYCHILQRCGLEVSFNKFGIQNVVAHAEVGFPIKLQEIAQKYNLYASYEPSLFPGLIFRSIEPKLVFLIFRSGQIVITGAKRKEDISATYEILYKSIIVKFRDAEGSTSSSSVYHNQIRQQLMMVNPPLMHHL